MFDALSDRLERIASRLRAAGGSATPTSTRRSSEIRTALLEADVELGVVRAFLDGVRARLARRGAGEGLTPGQQVIKAVHERAGRHPRRRDAQDHLRLAAADRRPARRPPGRGQDHGRGEAGQLVQAAGPQPDPRRRRPPASRGRRAAARARRADRRRRLLRGHRPGPVAARRPRRGPAPRPRRPDRRHRGPTGHRRGPDGRGPQDLGGTSSRTTPSSSSTP